MNTLTKSLDTDVVYATEMRDHHRTHAAIAPQGKRQENHVSKARFFSGVRRGLLIARDRVA